MAIHPASGNAEWQPYPDVSTLVTAASLEAIENALDLLMFPPVFAARQGTNQALAVNAFTLITFTASGVETIDTHNAHDPAVNPSRWTCPRDGIYLPSALVTTLNSTATRRACVIYKNGVAISETQVVLTPSNNLDQGIASKPHPVACSAGEYLEAAAFMNVASTSSAPNTSFSVVYLRPLP